MRDAPLTQSRRATAALNFVHPLARKAPFVTTASVRPSHS